MMWMPWWLCVCVCGRVAVWPGGRECEWREAAAACVVGTGAAGHFTWKARVQHACCCERWCLVACEVNRGAISAAVLQTAKRFPMMLR